MSTDMQKVAEWHKEWSQHATYSVDPAFAGKKPSAYSETALEYMADQEWEDVYWQGVKDIMDGKEPSLPAQSKDASITTGTYLDPETKVRRVRDSGYWGLPINTPIVAGMKPKPTLASNTPHVVNMAAPKAPSSSWEPSGYIGWSKMSVGRTDYYVGKEDGKWYATEGDGWDNIIGEFSTRRDARVAAEEAAQRKRKPAPPKRVVRRKKQVPEPRATVRKTVSDKMKDARFASLRLAKASLQEKDPDAQAELMERAHHYAREANKIVAGAKTDTNPDWQGNLRNPLKYDSPYATNLYACDMELIRTNMIETHMALAGAKPAIIAQKNPAKAASQLRRLYKELVAAADVDAENGYGSDQALDNLLNVIELLTVTYADMAKGSR